MADLCTMVSVSNSARLEGLHMWRSEILVVDGDPQFVIFEQDFRMLSAGETRCGWVR